MLSSVFSSGVLLLKDGKASVYGLEFDRGMQYKLGNMLSRQYEKLSKLDPEDFGLGYLTEDHQILRICNYQDPGKCIDSFLQVCDGRNSEILTKAEDLSLCKTLFFRLPQYPNYLLIQRFYKSYVATRDKWFSFLGANAITEMKEFAFTIASSLCGYYDIEKRTLYFQKLNSIMYALPGLAEMYSPEADLKTQEKFFTGSLFVKDSWGLVCRQGVTRKMAQIVWLIESGALDVSKQMKKLKEVDKKKDLQCIQNGRIVMSEDRKRNELILNVLGGNVLKDGEDFYLVNSKKKIG